MTTRRKRRMPARYAVNRALNQADLARIEAAERGACPDCGRVRADDHCQVCGACKGEPHGCTLRERSAGPITLADLDLRRPTLDACPYCLGTFPHQGPTGCPPIRWPA